MRLECFVAVCITITPIAARATDFPTDIRGEVKQISLADADEKKAGLLAVIIIEGSKTEGTVHDHASVRIVRSTVIKKRVGNELEDATLDDISAGVRVEGYFATVNTDFKPVKAKGQLIIILPPAPKK